MRQRKSPDNISVFFIHSVTKSAHNAPPIPRIVSPFLQVVLVDGIPLSSCKFSYSVLYLCIDDISTREQFAFLIATSESSFPQSIYALYFTSVCVT